MTARRSLRWPVLICAIAILYETPVQAKEPATPGALKAGDTAKDAELKPPGGEMVKLSGLNKQGPVVLVVLRGYPGYQCPLCTKQVGELRKHAEDFAEAGAKVVLVYPGKAEDLERRADEFLKGDKLPEPLMLVVDPDFAITKQYGLRWDAAGETAYPATFVLGKDRVVEYRKVSASHGDRAKTEEVLAALKKMKA